MDMRKAHTNFKNTLIKSGVTDDFVFTMVDMIFEDLMTYEKQCTEYQEVIDQLKAMDTRKSALYSRAGEITNIRKHID
jgi:hypothetical protein